MKKFKRIVSLGLILSLIFSCLGEMDIKAKDKKPIGTVGIIDDFGEHSTGDDYDTPSPVSTVRPTYVPTYTPLPVHTYTPVVYTPEPTEEPEFEEEVDRDPFKPPVENCEDEEPELKVRKFRFRRPDKDYYTYYDRMQWEKKHLNVNLPKYDAKHGAVKEVTPKIKYKTINYKKGMKSVTVKIKSGTVLPLRIKGAKKVKYDSDMRLMQNEKSNGKFKVLHCLDGSLSKPTINYTIKVDGKKLKVKVKIIKLKTRTCESYDNNFKSKYTWKSVIPCVGADVAYSGKSFISALKKDAKYYGMKYVDYRKYPKGKSEYCEWDRDTFKVQGIEMEYPNSVTSEYKASACKDTAEKIDRFIDTYKIPCAKSMTREECCKWIRRNGKFLRTAYNLNGKGLGSGCYVEILSYCISPIFHKASNYSLDEKYSPNSLVFWHYYNSKKSGMFYQWYKIWSEWERINDEDGYGYLVKGWSIQTWYGSVYCGASNDAYVIDKEMRIKNRLSNKDYQL